MYLQLFFQLLALVKLRQTLFLELVDRDLYESDVRSKAFRVISLLKLLLLIISAEDDELFKPELNLLDLRHVHSAKLVLCQMLLKLLNLVLELLNLFFVARHRVAEHLEDVLAGLFLGLRGEECLAQVLNVLLEDSVFRF